LISKRVSGDLDICWSMLMKHSSEFDHYATDYGGNLSRWVALTGESIEFYAHSRIKWVAEQLDQRGVKPRSILDFGCGVGIATPHILEFFGNEVQLTGVDVSLDSLESAKIKYPAQNVTFHTLQDYSPNSSKDLVYCNGVFHHIPLDERKAAVEYVFNSLRPGGIFALWENNPWNPITKYNMSHAKIDQNAIPLNPIYTRRLVISRGFTVLKVRFHFIFPAFLRFFRPLESIFSVFPIGAQYVVFCQKVEG
jgi:SAM-dependent methyltransferase